MCFDALNLIEFVMYQQGMAAFTKISSFYWLSHAYFSKYLKRLRKQELGCGFYPLHSIEFCPPKFFSKTSKFP